jgi:hypothetical protein
MSNILPAASTGAAPAIGAGHGAPADHPPAAEAVTKQVKQATQGVHRVRRHLRAIRMMLNALLILALLYTATLVRELLIPLVLAAFIGLALNPIVAAGARHRIPRWLCACVLMLSPSRR